MIWTKAVFALHALVGIPVLVPAFVPPRYTQSIQHTYAIVEERRPGYYAIDFAYTADCNGAHACSFAHIVGSKTPLTLGYIASKCNAYCNDASLTWARNGIYYRLMLNSGSLADLQRMRGSMHALPRD
jgi:hypothetical protein